MNKKGEVGPVGAVILFMIFLINWFIWLGAWLNTVGNNAIVDNNLSGLTAFFLSNLNFFVFISMLLGVIGWMYLGGGR